MDERSFLILIIFVIPILCGLMDAFPPRTKKTPPSAINDPRHKPPTTNPVYDSSGKFLYKIVDNGTTQYLFTSTGQCKGYYDVRSNQTFDYTGAFLAKGNALPLLAKH